MFKVEFGMIHNNCPTNQMSRAFPHVRFISPGGFELEGSMIEEVAAIHNPSDEDVEAVLAIWATHQGMTSLSFWSAPPSGPSFVGERPARRKGSAPRRSRGTVVSRSGWETQHDGLEQWTVGCVTRQQAQQLLEDLKQLGEVRFGRITETTWKTCSNRSVFKPTAPSLPFDATGNRPMNT